MIMSLERYTHTKTIRFIAFKKAQVHEREVNFIVLVYLLNFYCFLFLKNNSFLTIIEKWLICHFLVKKPASYYFVSSSNILGLF